MSERGLNDFVSGAEIAALYRPTGEAHGERGRQVDVSLMWGFGEYVEITLRLKL